MTFKNIYIEYTGFNFMSEPFINLMQDVRFSQVSEIKDLTLENSTSNGFLKKTKNLFHEGKLPKASSNFG